MDNLQKWANAPIPTDTDQKDDRFVMGASLTAGRVTSLGEVFAGLEIFWRFPRCYIAALGSRCRSILPFKEGRSW